MVLRGVAYGPTSGLDKRCAFCDAFPPEHVRYSQAGTFGDCPVIAARTILGWYGEDVTHYLPAATPAAVNAEPDYTKSHKFILDKDHGTYRVCKCGLSEGNVLHI